MKRWEDKIKDLKVGDLVHYDNITELDIIYSRYEGHSIDISTVMIDGIKDQDQNKDNGV